jgi:hypothetical protein
MLRRQALFFKFLKKARMDFRIGSIVDNNLPVIDIHDREYPVPYARTVVINVNNSQRVYDIPDNDFWRDKLIVGVATRKQDGSNTRYSKNGNLLIPQSWLGRAFLRLSQNNNQVVENIPLEMLVHEPGQALSYMQLIMDGGFSTSSSALEFSGTGALTGGPFDVELVFFYVPKNKICYQ